MSEFPTVAPLQRQLTPSSLASDAAAADRWTAAAFIAVADIAFAAIAAVLAVAASQPADAHFVEGGFITMVSAAQILTAAGVCLWIFQRRREAASALPQVWLLASIVLCVAAIDEAIAMHEQLDHAIHRWLALRETPWTDRIDDAIVAGYGFAALAGIWVGRRELKRFTTARGLLAAAIMLFFLMAVIDIASNSYVVQDEQVTAATAKHPLIPWVTVLEDTIKLLSEAVLLGALCVIAGDAGRSHGEA